MTTPTEDEARALIERFNWMRDSGVCSPTTRGLLDDAERMLLASRVSTPPTDEARAALAQRRQEAREADARETRERYGSMAASRVSTPPSEPKCWCSDVAQSYGLTDPGCPRHDHATPPTDEDEREALDYAIRVPLSEARIDYKPFWRLVRAIQDSVWAAGFRRQVPSTPEPEWEYGIRMIGTSIWAPTTAEHVAKVQAWHNGTYEFARRTAPGDWQPLPTEEEA